MQAQATRVLVVRHGETAWNVQTRVQGQLDIALNDTGRWQAARLARSLADEELAAVYSSDLTRARETARAIAQAAGLPVQTDAGLRERGFGIFEGHTFEQIEQLWPGASLRWRKRDPDFGADGGGETLRAFYARVVATSTRLASRHPGDSIALVTHGGVLDCLYRAAARLSLQAPRTWQLGNASINRLLYTEQGFAIVGWSDCTHLEQPAHAERAIDAS